MDGFPNNDNEASYLIDRGFFPDAFIVLRVIEDSIVNRLFQVRLDKWRAKMAEKREKKRQKLLKKKEKIVKKYKTFNS